MNETKYPVFRNPAEYMQCRVSNSPLGIFKRRLEEAALDRCLSVATGVRTVCDVPSGPGRLFPYWQKKDYRVIGIDVSEPMVQASEQMHRELRLEGSVGHGDAFDLEKHLPEKPDIVASVRFIYYFNREQRIKLLQSLARASRRYVLVQYKTTETLKGQKGLIYHSEKKRARHLEIRYCSHEDIIEELREAGLVPLHMDPVGEFSDRVYVLAEKLQADPRLSSAGIMPTIRLVRPWRYRLVLSFLILFGLIYALNFVDRSFWRESEALYSLGAASVLEGNWIMPRLNHDYPADRPPLMFWWVAAVSAAGGGVSEWTGRLANLLAGLGVLAALYLFARDRLGPWAALLGFIVLGTSYEFWENVTSIHSDILLLFFLTVAWGAMYGLLVERFHWGRWLLMWGALALATLTKGPIAIFLTVLIAPTFRLLYFGRRGFWSGLMRLRPYTGIALAIAPFLVWAGAVWYSEGFEPLRLILLEQNLQRLVDAFDHDKAWYYYFRELPINLLPWSVFLPFVAWWLMRRWHDSRQAGADEETRLQDQNRLHRYALSIILTVFVLFSLSSAKRDYYILPLMPWCALLIGDWLWRTLCVMSPVKVDGEHDEHEFGALLLGLKQGRVLIYIIVALFFAMAAYSLFATEWYEARKSAKPFALAVSKSVDADDRLIIFDDEDPRIWFYLRDRFDLASDDKEDLERIRALLASGVHVDLLMHADSVHRFLGNQETPLFVEDVLLYRRRIFVILTNDPSVRATPLEELTMDDLSAMVRKPKP